MPRSLNCRPDCAPSGMLTFELAAVQRVDGEFPAESRLHHRDRNATIKIRAVALEHRVRLDREEDVKIACRTAAHAGLALAAQANPRAVLDAGGNVDRERPFPGHASRSGAFVARIVDCLAAALTGRAGALDGEESLLRADAPVTCAGLARRRPRAGARSGAGAGLAGDRSRQLDGGGFAAERLFEGDFEIVAQVRSTLASAARPAAASAAHHVAEQILEDVGHRGREAVVHSAAVLKGGMAVAVVGGALLRIRQMLVGLVELLEARFGLLVAGMPVRMALHRRLAEGGLQLGFARRPRNAQRLVEIPFCHCQRARRRMFIGFEPIRSITAAGLSGGRRSCAARPCPRAQKPALSAPAPSSA